MGWIFFVLSLEFVYIVEIILFYFSYDGSLFKLLDIVCLSRGKLLVEKVIKDYDFIFLNSILLNVLLWGVKIFYIDDIRYYIE